MNIESPRPKFSFGLRVLVALVAIGALVSYLMNAASPTTAVLGLFLIAALLPALLLSGVWYGPEKLRVFYIGAAFPAAGFFLGLMVFSFGFIEILPFSADEFREYFGRVAPKIRAWSVIIWTLSAVVGTVTWAANLFLHGPRRVATVEKSRPDRGS